MLEIRSILLLSSQKRRIRNWAAILCGHLNVFSIILSLQASGFEFSSNRSKEHQSAFPCLNSNLGKSGQSLRQPPDKLPCFVPSGLREGTGNDCCLLHTKTIKHWDMRATVSKIVRRQSPRLNSAFSSLGTHFNAIDFRLFSRMPIIFF